MRGTGKRQATAGVMLSCILAMSTGVSESTRSEEPRNVRQLKSFLARSEAFGFSGSVLVARRGHLLFHGGLGIAQQEGKVPVRLDTVFSVASITKQFTAAAILKLESGGQLKTDDRIGLHLPTAPPDKAAITIRQLLTHTAGLPFACGSEPAGREELLDCLWSTPLDSVPGKRFSYSNAGYALLAALLEKITGQSYSQYLREHLFDRCAMSQTGFQDEPMRWEPRLLAHQYTWSADHGTLLSEQMDWNLRGSADVVTTSGDLFRWVEALNRGQVLPSGQVKKLFRRYREQPNGEELGYGWIIGRSPVGRVYRAGGTTTFGFNATLRYFPEPGISTIVLSNRNFGLSLPTPFVNQGIEGILFDRPYTSPPPTDSRSEVPLEQFSGEFVDEEGSRFRVEPSGQGLMLSAQGQSALDFLTGSHGSDSRQHERLNARTDALFAALSAGQPERIHRSLGAGAEETEARAYLAWMASLVRHNGPLLRHRVLGTIPQGEGSRTYVELEFRTGSIFRRLRWRKDRLSSVIPGGPPLVPTYFLPGDKNRFTGFHLAYPQARTIEFILEENRVQGLRIIGPGEGSGRFSRSF